MRLLSKLSAWIRSDRSLTLAGSSSGVVDGRRLPRVTSEVFNEALLGGVKDAYARATARAVQLDPSVYALVIPPGYGEGEPEERRLADDLENAVVHLRAHPGPLSSITWSTLRETKPPFGPDYRAWAAGLEAPFEGEAGLVFFVDIEAVGASVIRAAGQLGLAAYSDEEVPLVRVSDGRYEARVGLHALVAEALWTSRGPMAVVKARARQLPSEMRAFQSLLGGLTRRFLRHAGVLNEGPFRRRRRARAAQDRLPPPDRVDPCERDAGRRLARSRDPQRSVDPRRNPPR